MKNKIIDLIKPILIIAPSLYFMYKGAYDNYFDRISLQFIVEILINLIPIIAFFILDCTRINPKRGFWENVIQSSFYVYVYFLINYTFLYVPFGDFLFSLPIYDITQMQVHANFIPFYTILFVSTTTLQMFGNAMLLFPLGIYLPLLYNTSFRISSIIALLTTLGIELIQLIFSTIDSIYRKYPYDRAFDVDDLILNMVGATIGIGLSTAFCMLFLKKRKEIITPEIKAK